MPNCADCRQKPCQYGQALEGVPVGCPSKESDQARTAALYQGEERRCAQAAAAVEGHGYCQLTRVEEIMDYAMRCGYTKLGLAFCVGLSQEAAALVRVLRDNGFTVQSVCCKNAAVPKSAIGIPREDQVRPEREEEIMCNPIGQAECLNRAGTELNLILGLCVGHDTLFISHSRAPMTYVAVKDRVTGHNPLAAVYGAQWYFSRLHTFVKTHWGKK